MGMEWMGGGDRIGDIALDLTDIASNPYFGGQPLQIGANGLKLAKAATHQSLVGLAVNSSSEDVQNGMGSIVIGVAYVRLMNASDAVDNTNNIGTAVEGAPYDTTKTYTPGDKLYIDVTGLWTNVVAAGTEKGIVTKGNTLTDDAIEAIMFPTNLAATA